MSITTCEINGLVLSHRSIEDIEKIEDLIKASNRLATVLSGTVLYQIFNNTRSVRGVSKNIKKYEWEQFGNAMMGVNTMMKRRVEFISGMAEMNSTGKEKQFWSCIHDSVR